MLNVVMLNVVVLIVVVLNVIAPIAVVLNVVVPFAILLQRNGMANAKCRFTKCRCNEYR